MLHDTHPHFQLSLSCTECYCLSKDAETGHQMLGGVRVDRSVFAYWLSQLLSVMKHVPNSVFLPPLEEARMSDENLLNQLFFFFLLVLPQHLSSHTSLGVIKKLTVLLWAALICFMALRISGLVTLLLPENCYCVCVCVCTCVCVCAHACTSVN